MQKRPNRCIKVRFNSDVAGSMKWQFRPQQPEVVVGLFILKIIGFAILGTFFMDTIYVV